MSSPEMSDTAKLAQFIIYNGFATGHGDSVDSLLSELQWQLDELRERLSQQAHHQRVVDAAAASIAAERDKAQAELKHRCVCRFTSGGNLKGELCAFHKRLIDAERDRYRADAESTAAKEREICAATVFAVQLEYLEPGSDDLGTYGWLQRAEKAVRDSAIDAAKDAK